MSTVMVRNDRYLSNEKECRKSMLNYLPLAIIRGDEAFVKMALTKNQVDINDMIYQNHLILFKNNFNEKILNILILFGKLNINRSVFIKIVLEEIIFKDQDKRLKILLKCGLNPNTLVVDAPLIIHAITIKNVNMIDNLIEYGANLDVMDKNGAHTIFHTINTNNKIIMERLIDNGLFEKIPIFHGITPLAYASFHKHWEVFSLVAFYSNMFIEYGTEDHVDFITYIIYDEIDKFERYIFSVGDIPCIKQSIGGSILHLAVMCNSVNIFKLLLNMGFNVYEKDIFQRNIIDIISMMKAPILTKIINEHISTITHKPC